MKSTCFSLMQTMGDNWPELPIADKASAAPAQTATSSPSEAVSISVDFEQRSTESSSKPRKRALVSSTSVLTWARASGKHDEPCIYGLAPWQCLPMKKAQAFGLELVQTVVNQLQRRLQLDDVSGFSGRVCRTRLSSRKTAEPKVNETDVDYEALRPRFYVELADGHHPDAPVVELYDLAAGRIVKRLVDVSHWFLGGPVTPLDPVMRSKLSSMVCWALISDVIYVGGSGMTGPRPPVSAWGRVASVAELLGPTFNQQLTVFQTDSYGWERSITLASEQMADAVCDRWLRPRQSWPG
jgi:hypothetical protein